MQGTVHRQRDYIGSFVTKQEKAIVITLISVAVLVIFKELTGFLPYDFQKIKAANSVLF
jgi:hypothetical protein